MQQKLFFGILLCLFRLSSSAQHPAIGGYNVYYGDIHNHSAISDGKGTPSTAFNYAKNTAHLDFFGLTDHSGYLSSTSWADIRDQANASNQDGVFAAFYGFEWTTTTGYGHFGVLNTTDYYNISSSNSSIQDLVSWLVSRPEGIAFFNHPGTEDYLGREFSHFTSTASDQLVGMELWNSDEAFNIYYYNEGYYPGDNKGFFDEALERGWKTGAMGSGDNHNGTWGTASQYRMAILANDLTRTDLLAAMRQRRFFSTLDKNLSLSFKINGREMGSTLSAGNYTAQIQARDADGEIFTRAVIYDKNHNILNTWNLSTSFIDVSLDLNTYDGDFFYVKVTQADGNEAISSPIWISGGRSNINPACSITSPSDGTVYIAPAIITINANANDPDGSVSKVEFYSGETKLGEDLTSPFSFRWNNVSPGSYYLSVKATDNSYASKNSSVVSVSVNPGSITVAADNQTKVYGRSDPELTYHITSGSLSGSDTFSGSLVRDSGEDIGTYSISRGTLDLNSNYLITFERADMIITERSIAVTADDMGKIYGDPDPELTCHITSGRLIGSDTFSGSLARNAGENAGTYSIGKGTLSLNSNYILSFAGASFEIAPRPVTVKADGIAAVYGDPYLLTYKVTSGHLVGADSFSGKLSAGAGEFAGVYPIHQGSLSLGHSYILTYIGADLVINPRSITVIADSIKKVYGESDPPLTFRITSGNLSGSDTLILELSREKGEDVGAYFIDKSPVELNKNYLIDYKSGIFEITPRPVTVTATARKKVFGEPDPELTYKITSGTLVPDDTFSGTLIRDPGEKVGVYSIKPGDLTLSNNYTLTFIEAYFTIKADFEMLVYPNPFDDHLSFELEVNNNARISIELFSSTGASIATVFAGNVEPAIHRFEYLSDNLSRGLYIYRLTIDGEAKVIGKVIHNK